MIKYVFCFVCFFICFLSFSQTKKVYLNNGTILNSYIYAIHKGRYCDEKTGKEYPKGTDLLNLFLNKSNGLSAEIFTDIKKARKGDIAFIYAKENYTPIIIDKIVIDTTKSYHEKEVKIHPFFYIQSIPVFPKDDYIETGFSDGPDKYIIDDPKKIAFFIHPNLPDIIEEFEVTDN